MSDSVITSHDIKSWYCLFTTCLSACQQTRKLF